MAGAVRRNNGNVVVRGFSDGNLTNQRQITEFAENEFFLRRIFFMNRPNSFSNSDLSRLLVKKIGVAGVPRSRFTCNFTYQFELESRKKIEDLLLKWVSVTI